jgi:hypothetical protein
LSTMLLPTLSAGEEKSNIRALRRLNRAVQF